MRKLLLLLLPMLLLCGCMAGNDFETVRDEWPDCAPEEAPFEISVRLPPEAILTGCTQTKACYEAPNGDYTVITRVLVTDGLEAAVYELCGFDQTRLDLDGACRLAWQADGTVHRALIRREGAYCYVLELRLKEGLGREYNDMINGLFSSFKLVERVR